jgi:hypothetical protein
MKIKIITTLFLIPIGFNFSQDTSLVNVFPTIISCFDSSLTNADVMFLKGDSLYGGISYTPDEEPSNFVLLNSGEYTVKIFSFGLGRSEYEIIIPQTKEFHKTFIAGKLLPEEELIYNSKKAKEDIDIGIVRLLYFGLDIDDEKRNNFLKELQKEYGFIEENLGCDITTELYQSVLYYNREVNKYLDSINPNGWRKEFARRIEDFDKYR